MAWYSPHGRIHMDEELHTQHMKGREGGSKNFGHMSRKGAPG